MYNFQRLQGSGGEELCSPAAGSAASRSIAMDFIESLFFFIVRQRGPINAIASARCKFDKRSIGMPGRRPVGGFGSYFVPDSQDRAHPSRSGLRIGSSVPIISTTTRDREREKKVPRTTSEDEPSVRFPSVLVKPSAT